MMEKHLLMMNSLLFPGLNQMFKGLNQMIEFLNDIGNYESRKIARDTSDCGIEVSTCYSSDEGYETALIANNDVHPVERYNTREEAERGHYKWLVFAHDADGKIVKKLGAWGIVEDDGVLLKV